MKKKKRNQTILFLGIGILIILALITFSYRFLALKVQANVIHPQILIHKPYNQQELNKDTGTFIHATARAASGISRIEIWVDGEFFYAQEAPASEPISPLVVHTFWQPKGTGLHEIIIRAFDANEVEGTASVLVTANNDPAFTEPPSDPTGIVEAGELPKPGGDSTGGEPQPASDSESGSSAPPADYVPPDPAPPPAEGEDSPSILPDDFQFLFLQVFDVFSFIEGDENLPDPAQNHILKLEALELETGVGYDGVHCYVAMGERTPSWYPDTDSNPATDENFTHLGDGMWNIADYLAGDHGVIAYWPGDTPLPFEINCVGYIGGTEAYDLGRVEVSIPSSEWDGITRQVHAFAEGSFTLSYRISIEEPVPLELNPDVPSPFHLTIDERRQELSWEWEPNENTPYVVGYLIFVNDVLVYRVSEPTRAIRLPYMWFNPPCDVNYRFNVVAYLNPYPEGDYSAPSSSVFLPALEDEPRTNCQPEFIVSFDTLVTGDLGGDDIPNNWTNQVEPVHGSFFANDKSVEFFNTTLLPNYAYAIDSLINVGSMAHFVYEAQEGEVLRLGFDLIDYDDGNNELLCTNAVFHDYSYSMLMEYGYFEDTLVSLENDGTRCQVHYTIRPLSGVAGAVAAGSLPLPWLDVTALRIDPVTGNVQVDVRNTGSAEWANQDLQIQVIKRDTGRVLDLYTINTFLDIGQENTYTTDVSVENIGNVCIILDPIERILELYENTGAIQHATFRYCLPQPDLVIHEVQFNTTTNTFRINVHNQGESSSNIVPGGNTFNAADILLQIDPTNLEAVSFITPVGIFPSEILSHHDSIWIEWTITPEARELLADGYSVTIDPLNNFAETDETNNTYYVNGGTMVRIAWDGIYARWYPNVLQECHNWGRWANNDIEIWVDIYARTEISSFQVGSWHWEGDIGDTHDIAEYSNYRPWDTSNNIIDFFINGEENLIFEIRGEQDNTFMGAATGTFYNWNNWDIMQTVRQDSNDCDLEDGMGYLITAYPDDWDWGHCGGWGIYVNICKLEP